MCINSMVTTLPLAIPEYISFAYEKKTYKQTCADHDNTKSQLWIIEDVHVTDVACTSKNRNYNLKRSS